MTAPPPPADRASSATRPDTAARRRKRIDAARVLPFAGLFAVVLPILWAPGAGDPPRATASDGIYFFALWAVLIVAAFALARGLDRTGAGGRDAGDPAPPHDDAED